MSQRPVRQGRIRQQAQDLDAEMWHEVPASHDDTDPVLFAERVERARRTQDDLGGTA